jgi:hypothetical protein
VTSQKSADIIYTAGERGKPEIKQNCGSSQMVEAFFVLEYNRWKEPTEMKGWTMDKCEN